MELLFFHKLGMSSSQLTKSYFAEGLVNHQPDSSPLGYFHSWILTCQHKDCLFCGMKWIILPFARDVYRNMMSIPHWWWNRFGLIGLVHSLAGVVGTLVWGAISRKTQHMEVIFLKEFDWYLPIIELMWFIHWNWSMDFKNNMDKLHWTSLINIDESVSICGRRNSHSGLRQQASPLPWYQPVWKGTTPYINPISMFFYMSRS